ncbi:hypothetical protein K474DRAFT_1323910 [Panus rudis PR-1116 ss-1]|nr:hypothetical protein K474DRAFT_1323910 [Panus rudis PR-1116 ss-1]
MSFQGRPLSSRTGTTSPCLSCLLSAITKVCAQFERPFHSDTTTAPMMCKTHQCWQERWLPFVWLNDDGACDTCKRISCYRVRLDLQIAKDSPFLVSLYPEILMGSSNGAIAALLHCGIPLLGVVKAVICPNSCHLRRGFPMRH